MRYKGVIFDLDGVICCTDKYHYQAWRKVADSIGVYFDEEINNQLRGISRKESLDIILKKSKREYSEEEKEILSERKNHIYQELLQTMKPDDLSEEVKSTLKFLKERGVKIAIGSSSKNAKVILLQLGLEKYFDAVSDGTNISKSKPNPEVFIKAAHFLKLKESECLVVEDAKAGVDAAIAGGFDSAGIGEASRHTEVTYSLCTIKDLILDVL